MKEKRKGTLTGEEFKMVIEKVYEPMALAVSGLTIKKLDPSTGKTKEFELFVGLTYR